MKPINERQLDDLNNSLRYVTFKEVLLNRGHVSAYLYEFYNNSWFEMYTLWNVKGYKVNYSEGIL